MIVKTNGARILSFAAAVGKKEGEGPLKNRFDYIDTDDRFGMETWEKAESECTRLALSLALSKAPLALRHRPPHRRRPRKPVRRLLLWAALV